MTITERREKARLRSERWRRAHGIGPRRPAQRPCLAMGISRSTYFRRRKLASQQVALADRQAMIVRAEVLAVELMRDLERCAMLHALMTRELAVSGVFSHACMV